MHSKPPASHAPTTVSLADEEAVKGILADTLFGLWATVNNPSRLRPCNRERYRVTVFGSQPARALAGRPRSTGVGMSPGIARGRRR
jgi:hypothetical protein